ncbi:MAG: hydantoinase B/oxoprolinase family protein [Wenzhouxiangellaceae bacterium]
MSNPVYEASDAVALAVFASRLTAVCETMGAMLRRAAFSPNIRDRLDYSCALFDARGRLLAQATHIPVHLGSMAWAMRDLADRHDWRPGSCLVLNDPFAGGTHLPDVTLIEPAFIGDELTGFVVNRAHHADIGAAVPGSLPLSQRIEDEGVLISPSWIRRDGRLDVAMLESICSAMRSPDQALGDFRAQIAACDHGRASFEGLITEIGVAGFHRLGRGLNAYARRLAEALVEDWPSEAVQAEDRMDCDGAGGPGPVLRVSVRREAARIIVDFTGTDAQVPGNLNCPLSVTAAAVHYVFRCLLPDQTPNCAGAFDFVDLRAPSGCLVNACPPAATAAGNVETSQRIVDVLLRALHEVLPERIPAASQGTMNNLGMGGPGWSYYETIAGGCGAGPGSAGRSAVHSHMTNTLNTPAEVMESCFPVRITRMALRRGSGGQGRWRGGDGIEREFQFLAPVTVTLITERRRFAPWGLAGGQPGQCGENRLDGKLLPSKVSFDAACGQRLLIATPGGGGYGTPDASTS